MLVDVVILPPEKIRSKIGARIKKAVGKLPNYFVVDNKKLIPHLSLWHLKTSDKKLPKIVEELAHIVSLQKPVKITSSKFREIPKYKGCIEFSVKNSSSMIVFQKKVFEGVYKYKTGIMPKFASFLKLKVLKQKSKEVKKYGRGLGFHPHFTMGWLVNSEDASRVVKKMEKLKFSFLAKEVYICEVDEWWQVKRIIKRIDFGL